MRRYAFIVLLVSMVFAMCAFQPVGPRRVIFFGDSITQQGAKGNGYINIMHWMLDSAGRSSQYELIRAGIGGNKIYDLLFRVDEDVIAKRADVVYVFIGVNDVWAKTTSHTGTDPDRFDAFYESLVQKLQKAGSKVVICTPICIGEKRGHKNPDDPDLDRYCQLAREVSYRNNTGLCDLRMLFFTWNEANNPLNKPTGNLTTDGVHLNDAGNDWLAKEMLKAMPQ